MMADFISPSCFQSFIFNWFNIYFDVMIKSSIILISLLLLTLSGKKIAHEMKHFFLFISICSLVIILMFSIKPVYESSSNHNTFNKPVITIENEIKLKKPEPKQTRSINNETALTENSTKLLPSVLNGLFFIWAVGFLICMVKLVSGIVITKNIKSKSLLIRDRKIILIMHHLAHKTGLKKSIYIYEANIGISPITAGIAKPFIIIPGSYKNWDYEQLEAAILHELFHIKRHDNLTQTVSLFLCSLFWINPLIWIVNRKLRFERECACDENVVSSGIKPYKYAEQLLETVKSLSRSNPLLTLGSPMAHALNIERRITYILAPSQKLEDTESIPLLEKSCAIVQSKKKSMSFNRVKLFVAVITLLLALLISMVKIMATDNVLENGAILIRHSENGTLSVTGSKPYINIQNAEPNEIPTLFPLSGVADTSEDNYSGQSAPGGIDIFKSPECMPILAAADGTVAKTAIDKDGSLYIVLRHKYSLITFYGPIYETFLKPGDEVKRGDIIAYSYGIRKIHYEIRCNQEPLDAVAFLQAGKLRGN